MPLTAVTTRMELIEAAAIRYRDVCREQARLRELLRRTVDHLCSLDDEGAQLQDDIFQEIGNA